MSASVAVLFVNDAFYTAFAARDLSLMEALWSQRDAISCLHPGWPRLIGRDEVMRSWASILGNTTAPQIRCLQPAAFINGDAAYVVCYERLSEGFLLATNIFVKEDGVWKMVHHQAGAAPPPESESGDEFSEPPSLQ